jgi:hypothetical protein
VQASVKSIERDISYLSDAFDLRFVALLQKLRAGHYRTNKLRVEDETKQLWMRRLEMIATKATLLAALSQSEISMLTCGKASTVRFDCVSNASSLETNLRKGDVTKSLAILSTPYSGIGALEYNNALDVLENMLSCHNMPDVRRALLEVCRG